MSKTKVLHWFRVALKTQALFRAGSGPRETGDTELSDIELHMILLDCKGVHDSGEMTCCSVVCNICDSFSLCENMDSRWNMSYIKSAEEIIAGIANEIVCTGACSLDTSRTGTQSVLELGASNTTSSTERESPIPPNRTVSTTRSMALDAILKLDSCLFGPEAVVAWHVLTPAAHDKRVDMIRVHCDLNSSAALYNIVPDADSHHTHVPRDVFTLRMEHHACTDNQELSSRWPS